jgi:hypothetical protein
MPAYNHWKQTREQEKKVYALINSNSIRNELIPAESNDTSKLLTQHGDHKYIVGKRL